MSRHSRHCTCHERSFSSTKKYIPLLRKIAKSFKKVRANIFKKADCCAIKYIGQCAKCLLKDIIKLPDSKYRKLKNHKEELIYLANDKIPIKDKRACLINKGGGFISIILPILTSAIAAVVGNLISH